MASRIVWPVLFLAGILLCGCTEATPNSCQKSGDCTGGKVCDVARGVCIAPDAAVGPMDGAHEPVGLVDTPHISDASGAMEANGATDAPYTNEVSAAIGHSSPVVTKRYYDHHVRKTFSAGITAGLKKK